MFAVTGSFIFWRRKYEFAKKQIAAENLKLKVLTNAPVETVKVKGQGCKAKSGRDEQHWLAISNYKAIIAPAFGVSNS